MNDFKLAMKLCFVFSLFIISLYACNGEKQSVSENDIVKNNVFGDSVWFEYEDVTGIGYDPPFTRRDPSDVIVVNGTYYVWYTKVKDVTPGYWGTIWYSISRDEGHHWEEKGEALDTGPAGSFDSFGVFTPNILYDHGKYFLFYTAVKPTPNKSERIFENNSTTDITAIGVAIANNPNGPFVRLSDQPILQVSNDTSAFDSYRVDDAALLVRDGKYYLYYKGRSRTFGEKGPGKTEMGVAIASQPDGPYKKFWKPLLERSHEVLIWNHDDGVAALASLSSTLEFAPDGLNFNPEFSRKVTKRPSAPGLFRPHLTDHSKKEIPGWGISMGRKTGYVYLIRFEMKPLSKP